MEKAKYVKNAILYLVIIAVLIALDQYTKDAAVAHLMGSDPYIIFDNVFELLYVENRGAAFGMMNGMRSLFLIIAPLLSLVLFVMAVRLPSGKKFLALKICFIGIVAGALGNFIDRLTHVYVVDFFYFMPIDFPVFNVADIYVTCSTFLMIFVVMFYYSDDDLKFLWPFGSSGTKEVISCTDKDKSEAVSSETDALATDESTSDNTANEEDA